MKTNDFFSVKTESSIQKCLEYSDNSEKLKNLLNEIEISLKFTGIRKYFPDDEKERLTGIFRIERNGHSIEFDFGFSLRDTAAYLIATNYNPMYDLSIFDKIWELIKEDWRTLKKSRLDEIKQNFNNSLLYDCLASCKSEYSISIDFDDFCDEFGYSNDSIKAKNIWESALKLSNKLHKIFKDEEIDRLPS